MNNTNSEGTAGAASAATEDHHHFHPGLCRGIITNGLATVKTVLLPPSVGAFITRIGFLIIVIV